MYRVDYDVVRRPSNTNKGLTRIVGKVTNGADVNVLQLGYIEKLRGAEYFDAFVQVSDTNQGVTHEPVAGQFRTRSQAAHAIDRQYKILNPNLFN